MRLYAPLLLFLGTLLAAAPASAQCFSWFQLPPSGWAMPSSGDTPVPTNTWIWYVADYSDQRISPDDTSPSLRLQPLDREEPVELIGLGVIDVPGGAVFAYQPAEELSPLTDHELRFNRDLIEPALPMTVSFRTGEGPDFEAPPVPELLGKELFTDFNQLATDPCRVEDYRDEASYFVESAGALNLLADASAVRAGELFGDALDVTDVAKLSLTGNLGVGAQVEVQIATVDLAGNFSGWSETQTDRMPAAGCVANGDGKVSQASLLLAGLLLLAGRLRRRAGRRGPRRDRSLSGPLLWALLLALALPVAVPSTAAAGSARSNLELTLNDHWRADLDAELRPIEQAWAGVSLGAGALQLTWLALQPARAPYALQLSIINTGFWLPTVATLVTLAISRQAILTSRSVPRARRAIRGAAITLGVFSMVLGTFALPVGILLGANYDPSLAFAVLAVPMSMAFSAITAEDVARRIRRHMALDNRAERRVVAPRLLAAGPTGVVIVF